MNTALETKWNETVESLKDFILDDYPMYPGMKVYLRIDMQMPKCLVEYNDMLTEYIKSNGGDMEAVEISATVVSVDGDKVGLAEYDEVVFHKEQLEPCRAVEFNEGMVHGALDPDGNKKLLTITKNGYNNGDKEIEVSDWDEEFQNFVAIDQDAMIGRTEFIGIAKLITSKKLFTNATNAVLGISKKEWEARQKDDHALEGFKPEELDKFWPMFSSLGVTQDK